MKTILEEQVTQLRKMADSNLWRDEKDPTISLMGFGNIESFLRLSNLAVAEAVLKMVEEKNAEHCSDISATLTEIRKEISEMK